MRSHWYAFTFGLAFTLSLEKPLCSQQNASPDPGHAPESSRQWFEDAKFGLFIHWGVYSVLGNGEWVMNNEKIPIAEYEKLPPKFNPTGFDAAEWVSIAKRAGQKYITITSKHHDGFCMWSTKQTKYNIVDGTPYGKDVLRMLSDECKKQGLKLLFYHSHLDWHHPDYFPRGSTGKTSGRPESGEWSRYMDYMNAQIAELASPPYEAAGFWFDGWWDRPDADWQLAKTYGIIHKLRPGALVGNNHHHAPFPGEDFQMFEQDLPGKNSAGFNKAEVSRMPLETCRTMNNSWGFNKNDKGYRPLAQQIRFLVEACGHGANLLLNIGPTPEGKIPPEAVETLLGIGKWLEKNGESIYGTRQGPWAPAKWGYSVRKGSKAYLHLLEWPADGALTLPKVDGLVKAGLFNGAALTMKTEGDSVRIDLPANARDPIDTIVVIESSRDFSGPVVAIPPARVRLAAETALTAADAEPTGRIRLEPAPKDALGYWTDAKDTVTWRVDAAEAGGHEVDLTYACAKGSGGSEVEIASGASRLALKVHETGDWNEFVTVPVGILSLPKGPGEVVVSAKSKPGSAPGVLNLRSLALHAGFVPLFDGRTTEGWTDSKGQPSDGYRAENGVLVCDEKKGGNLYTAKEYSDFAFRFEFKLDHRSNNGVGLRTQRGAHAATQGMEIQILDDPGYEKELQPWQRHGSIYGIVPARPGSLRPTGEWNVEEVLCDGRKVKVTLNGHVIVDADLDQEVKRLKEADPKSYASHPGIRPEHTKGYISFAGHESRIEFRNIRIKELRGK